MFIQKLISVVGFIRVRADSYGSLGFAYVHSGAVGIGVVRVGSLGHALGSSALFGFSWVHSGAPKDRRVHSVGSRWGRCFHSGSRGFTPAHQVVVGFIRVRVGSLWRA